MTRAGRAVLVTGASRGIGAAIAQAFAASGDRVAVHYVSRRDAATEVCATLPGDGHVVVGADLADPEAVRRMVDEVAGGLGGIDVLVNNAGVFEPHAATETTYEQWQEAWSHTLGVNLIGAANVTWCALRHMGAGGRIVNVSSRGAFRGEPNHPAYGASKAGLIAFGQSLARALGDRRISVTAVAPGFVETDMAAAELEGESGRRRRAESPFGQSLARALGDRRISVTAVAPGFVETDMAAVELEGETGRRRRAESPFGRVATPEEVAAAVHYLASPEAELASGTVLDVNGASYLRM